MTITVADEVLGRFSRMQHDHFRRLREGVYADPEFMMKKYQRVIEGREPNPSINQVNSQLHQWERLGVHFDSQTKGRIREQARVFAPLTATDRPLVTGGFGYSDLASLVPRLFDAFGRLDWRAAPHPVFGGTRFMLRYVSGHGPQGPIRLVHYDPNAYQGVSPTVALERANQDGVRLASIEVFELLMLDPEWRESWDGAASPYPNISAIQLGEGQILRVRKSDTSPEPEVELEVATAGRADPQFASATVKEC